MIPQRAIGWGTALLVLLWASESLGADASDRIRLSRDWQLRSATLVAESGAEISSPEYAARGWHTTGVPTTVLSALVRNGVYPDPYTGMNNMKIPDACEEFNQRYDLGRFSHLPGKRNPWLDPYWFRTAFELPEECAGKTVRLHLPGINYRAEVWLNGHRVAHSGEIVGMFGSWVFEIGALARTDALNALAVKVYPLDVPGIPGAPQLEAFGPFGLNGGETGDVGVNVTMQCSVGWDWLPAVRDRNMGIWQEVVVTWTGPVDIRDLRVITDLPLPALDRAMLDLSADLANTTASPRKGSLILRVTLPDTEVPMFILEQRVTLESGETREVHFCASDYPQLTLRNPRLWWPNGLGEPALYRLEMRFETEGEVSDRERMAFGVREVGSTVTEVDGWMRRDFFVNGHRVPLKGGAWVPDMMLNRDHEKLRHELSLCRHANLNLIRIWGGGVTPPEDFFSLCDRLGLLVWHDFWITGDCQGTWGKGSQAFPYQAQVFLRNAVDTVKRLRSHPCLLVWTAGNEGYPREEIYIPLRSEILAKLDGTRPFIPSSGYREPPQEWGLAWPDNGKAGTYSGGPYCWVDPRVYYARAEEGRDWLFKNEVGVPSLPVLESLAKFIPDLSPAAGVPFPLNHAWGYHDACEGNGKYSLYDQAIRRRYGEPGDLAGYVNKAQLVNAESYRAIFEAVNHVGNLSAGVLLWKVNPAWPSVIWQLYDWYLCPHAGYYFTKRACEPLHIQLNPVENRAMVINHGREDGRGLTAEAQVFASSGEKLWGRSEDLDIESGTVRELFPVPETREEGIRFVRVRLRNGEGKRISDGIYWLEKQDDFSGLEKLPPVLPACEVTAVEDRGGRWACDLRIHNPRPSLAFFLHARVVRGRGGPEVLPAFWSDNYFSLTPGETRTVSVEIPQSSLTESDADLYLCLSGINCAPQFFRIQSR